MKFSDTLKRSGRNLAQAKARTLLTALALAVGGFTLTLTLAASQGARQYANRLVNTNFDASSLVVSKDKSIFSGGDVSTKPQPYNTSLQALGGGSFLIKTLSINDVNKIRSLPGVDSVLLYYQAQARYAVGPNGNKYTASFETYSGYVNHQFTGGSIGSGGVTTGSVVLPNDYVNLLGYGSPKAAVGKSISLFVQQVTGQSSLKTYRIAAVEATPSTLATNVNSDDLLFSQADAKALSNFINAGTTWYNRFITVSAHVHDGQSAAQLQKVKSEIQRAGYNAESVQDTEQFLNQIINVLQAIILVFGLITLVASFFGVVNTQYISVLQRTREIGLMKALGMSRRTVLRLFIVEATWIGFLGAVIGSVAAFVLGTLLNPWISRKLNFGSDRLLIFKPAQLVILVIFLMAVTTLAGVLPARKASRLDPIEALRVE